MPALKNKRSQRFGDDEDQDSTEEGKEKETDIGILPTEDIAQISACLNPSYRSLTVKQRIESLRKLNSYMVMLYASAVIALWVVIGVLKATLGMGRIIPIYFSVITPSTGHGGFNDAFTVNARHVSDFPPTVIIAVAATWAFVYYAAHAYWQPIWIGQAVYDRTNAKRWAFLAVFKSLLFSVLFLFNGERELTAFMYLSIGVAGACLAAHALDDAVSESCAREGKTTSQNSSCAMGTFENVTNYGRVLVALTAVLLVAFILRLGYNANATPTWVMALSTAVLIWEVLGIWYYVYTTYDSKCNCKSHGINFVSGERWIMISNFISFSAITAVTFGEIAAM